MGEVFTHRGAVDIIYEPHAVKEQLVEIRRSWGERLFSLPWRPWQRTKEVIVKVPCMFLMASSLLYEDAKTTLICHPALREELERRLNEEEL